MCFLKKEWLSGSIREIPPGYERGWCSVQSAQPGSRRTCDSERAINDRFGGGYSIRFASSLPQTVIHPHAENVFIQAHVDSSAADYAVAFDVACTVGVVDVQVLEFSREGARYDEFKAGPRRPIEADALRHTEGLAHNVLSYVADRDTAGHVGQKAIERISEPEARSRHPPALKLAIEHA